VAPSCQERRGAQMPTWNQRERERGVFGAGVKVGPKEAEHGLAGNLTRAKDGVNEGSVARPWSQGLAASPGVRRWRQQARPCSGSPKVL
jgi:hypothetical protein